MIFNLGVRVRATAAMTLMALSLSAPALSQEDDAIFDRVVDATVRVDAVSTGRHGTGWVILTADTQNRAGAAVIVTSYNIVERSSQIRVREPGSTEYYYATVLGSDPDRNLTFLEVKDIKAKQLTLTRIAPKVGMQVRATGYNRAADLAEGDNQIAANATLGAGVLSRELRGPVSTEARAEVNQLEHDARLLPGFEGGPLVDRCGRVIGINMKSGEATQPRSRLLINGSTGVNNALKSDEIIKAAADRGIKPSINDDTECVHVAKAPVVAPSEPVVNSSGQASGDSATIPGLGSMSRSTLLLGLAVLLGLAAAAFGIFTLTRRNAVPAPAWEPPAPEPEVTPPVNRNPGGGSDPGTTSVSRVGEQQLRLSGRSPSGEPIELSLSSGSVGKNGVMLGVGANADVRIPDNRPEYRVSRLHARIAFDGRNFTIEDNKSLNKTSVGSRTLDPNVPTPLVNGDRVKLADVELAVTIS